MKADGGGYSLVEIMVAIAILSTLAAIGTLNFREYSQRYRAESQTRMLYQEILKARSAALYQRRAVSLKLYRERFELYSTGHKGGVGPVRSVTLSFPLRYSREPDDGGAIALIFDSRGIVLKNCTICIDSDTRSPVDSVVVYKTRVRIGKREDPKLCEEEGVSTR